MVSAFSAAGLAGGVIQAEGVQRLAVVAELAAAVIRPLNGAEHAGEDSGDAGRGSLGHSDHREPRAAGGPVMVW